MREAFMVVLVSAMALPTWRRGTRSDTRALRDGTLIANDVPAMTLETARCQTSMRPVSDQHANGRGRPQTKEHLRGDQQLRAADVDRPATPPKGDSTSMGMARIMARVPRMSGDSVMTATSQPWGDVLHPERHHGSQVGAPEPDEVAVGEGGRQAIAVAGQARATAGEEPRSGEGGAGGLSLVMDRACAGPPGENPRSGPAFPHD